MAGENQNNGAPESPERARRAAGGLTGAVTAAADPHTDSPRAPDPAADALALAEEAEAEAAEAEALAAAARARAKAMRLRRQARSPVVAPEPGEDVADRGEVDQHTVASDVALPAEEEAGTGEAVAGRPDPEPRRARRLWTLVALVCTGVLVCALLAASGYMVWRHRQAVAEQHRSAEFVAAARQGVVSLLSLDFNHAKEDVQRVIDNSTGQFRDDFASRADDFTKVMQESKVVTTATVNAAAVQSMTANSAVVLVSATSQVTNATGARNESRAWRLAVSVTSDGGQVKMSKVEFVP